MSILYDKRFQDAGGKPGRAPIGCRPAPLIRSIQAEQRYGPVLIAQDTLTLTDSVSSPTATGAAAARPVAIRR